MPCAGADLAALGVLDVGGDDVAGAAGIDGAAGEVVVGFVREVGSAGGDFDVVGAGLLNLATWVVGAVLERDRRCGEEGGDGRNAGAVRETSGDGVVIAPWVIASKGGGKNDLTRVVVEGDVGADDALA